METSLHRQLKDSLTSPAARREVKLGRYRIDAIDGDELVEIQHGKLLVIRDKVADLLKRHRVRVVKPIVGRKTLRKFDAPAGELLSTRKSPKEGALVDLVHELVYFTRVFPHPRLTLDVPLVDIEEDRGPLPPTRRKRFKKKDYVMIDQRLVEVTGLHRFRTSADLLKLLPEDLPAPFTTAHLSERMAIPRWVAQRLAYCLRKCGAIVESGKIRHAMSYSPAAVKRKRARAKDKSA